MSIEDFRQHVFDDATDLASLLGMMKPIFRSTAAPEFLIGVKSHGVSFLRRQLSQALVLVVARMFEPPREGRTGSTASLVALINQAALRYPATSFAAFKARADQIAEELGQSPTWPSIPEADLSELRDYRNSELGHSLHRHTPPKGYVLLGPISAMAEEAVRLFADVDGALIATRDFPGWLPFSASVLEEWDSKGTDFWA